MKKQTGIDALNNHLFETIEGLKNNHDPKADDCEKISVETAREISNISKIIIEGYKVKAQVVGMLANSENPMATKKAIVEGGFVEDIKELPQE